jgi:ferredoxin
VDGRLRLLRYGVLAAALALTYQTGELVLRGYDPYFLVFSGFGHGSAGAVSFVVLALTALGALAVPLMFCRYLCPMGAVLDPLGRAGLARLRRDESRCTACGRCAAACPHGLPVDKVRDLTHRDCTNCLECADACAQEGALRLQAAGRPIPWPKAVLAALAVLALTGGYHLRAAFTQPTTVTDFSARPAATAMFIVDGLHCKGTAWALASLYDEVPGIARLETYAAEHKAVFTYDPKVITPDGIRAVMEAPVELEDGAAEPAFKARPAR